MKCAICGTKATLNIQDMGRPNGRGYQGSFSVGYKCNNCGIIKVNSSDTVYHTMEEALEIAEKNWNTKMNEIEKLLKWRC